MQKINDSQDIACCRGLVHALLQYLLLTFLAWQLTMMQLLLSVSTSVQYSEIIMHSETKYCIIIFYTFTFSMLAQIPNQSSS